MVTETPLYLTAHEVAQALGLTPTWVRQLADDGRIPAIRTLSGWRLFLASDVEQYRRKRDARRQLRESTR